MIDRIRFFNPKAYYTDKRRVLKLRLNTLKKNLRLKRNLSKLVLYLGAGFIAALIIIIILLLRPPKVVIADSLPFERIEVNAEKLSAADIKPVSKAEVVDTTPTVKTPPAPTGDCHDWIKQAGVTDIANAYDLIMRESGCSPTKYNTAGSGAYGIPQALPGSKMASHGADWQTNPITQIKWMNDYCISRYGSWAAANAFQRANNWY